jgi:hypothetical protein
MPDPIPHPEWSPEWNAEAQRRLSEHWPTHGSHVFDMLTYQAERDLPFDVTFLDREPILEVRLSADCTRRLFAGLIDRGTKKLRKVLDALEFSDGTTASFSSIWGIHPMPRNGFTILALDNADMHEGEPTAGPNQETIREMLRKMYRCRTEAEEDYLLRRFIVS